jgi:hypothetical protein
LKKKELAQTNSRVELAEEIKDRAEGIENLEEAELAEEIEKGDEENMNRVMDA